MPRVHAGIGGVEAQLLIDRTAVVHEHIGAVFDFFEPGRGDLRSNGLHDPLMSEWGTVFNRIFRGKSTDKGGFFSIIISVKKKSLLGGIHGAIVANPTV